MDIDFISYFDLLADLKKNCNFDVFEGDKFFYLRGDRVVSDYEGLVECRDDSDVRNMLVSYKRHKEKSIEIYALSKDCDIFMSTEENSSRENASEEVNEVFVEELESANSTGSNVVKRKTRGPTRCIKIINLQEGEKLPVEFDDDDQAIGKNATQFTWFLGQTVRNRICCPLKVSGWKEIEEEKIDHMWDIILEKFNFDVSEGRKGAILGHMSDIYRGYRHKMKSRYFDSKTTYQLRLRNKPKLVNADEWKYLVNLWSDADFQKKSMQNKTNRSKRSLPPYIGTKSYARLRHEMAEKKDGKTPSRVEVFMESRKRKKGKQVDAFQQDAIVISTCWLSSLSP
ncbi:uncharacterized protein LOC132615462 [Lycium barbarum]|uniref:uncharacterized protein LOC132615462 n=1 Tax=Lycium barbarum TaxID=112863 RepID=UPI00293E5324|nr:uncharacterized protein LOC132615462 [Lycium barbarum]